MSVEQWFQQNAPALIAKAQTAARQFVVDAQADGTLIALARIEDKELRLAMAQALKEATRRQATPRPESKERF